MKNVGRISSIFLCLIVKEVTNQLCADPAKFGHDLNLGRMSPETPFLELSKIGLVQCMQTCIQHALCKSINFKGEDRCELLSRDDIDEQVVPNSVYSRRIGWASERIAGRCGNHDCSNNSQCVPQMNGSIACVTVGCVSPTNESGHIHPSYSKALWAKGERLTVSCLYSDLGKVQVMCEESGQWSERYCLPVDCADAASRGMNFSLEIEIDVDGPAGNLSRFNVSCNSSLNRYETIVEHISGVLASKDHEDPYSQKFDIEYNSDLDAITRLIKISQSCSQRIHITCINVLIRDHAAWVTRHNKTAQYFAGNNASYVGCDCGLTGSCDTPYVKCNCDVNDYKQRSDNGIINNMDDLPVIGYRSGDTGSTVERMNVTLGPLRCFKDK